MKQEIAKIRNAFSEENKIPAAVDSAVNAIEKQYETLNSKMEKLETEVQDKSDSIDELYKESKKRQSKVQELERDLEGKETEIEKIKNDTSHEDYDDLKKEVEGFRTEKKEAINKSRKDFVDSFDKLKEHSDWETSKKFYNIPEEKDGKLDWDSLEDDVMLQNVNKLNEHKELGFFSDGSGGRNELKPGQVKKAEDNVYTKQFKKN